MQVLEQSPTLVVCHQSATYMRAFGLLFSGLGAGALVLVTHVDASHTSGSPWVAYVVGVAFVLAGVLMFCKAEDDRIVLDGAAHVARIIRRGLWRRSMTEVPFAKIQDVALEVTRMSNVSNNTGNRLTWRPVFVCENNNRVPWTPMSTSDRASQARAVAAARAIGGWNALPVEGSPALAQAARAVNNIGCLYAFCAVFFGILLLIMGVQVAPLATWVPTPATVVASGVGVVRTSKGATYQPTVSYRYTVGGTPYISNRVSVITESASDKWAQSVVDRYPQGASVTAWYDPKHPGNAIIDHHMARIPLIMMGIGLVMVLLVLFAAKRGQAQMQSALAGGDVPVVPAR
jgi:hypothetical protein